MDFKFKKSHWLHLPHYQIISFAEFDTYKDSSIKIGNWILDCPQLQFYSFVIDEFKLKWHCLELLAFVLHAKPPREMNLTNGSMVIRELYVIDSKVDFYIRF